MDLLERNAHRRLADERRPQDLVASDDAPKRLAQTIGVERPGDVDKGLDAPRRTVRRVEPRLLLLRGHPEGR